MVKENWKNFPGLSTYEVSDLGRVRPKRAKVRGLVEPGAYFSGPDGVLRSIDRAVVRAFAGPCERRIRHLNEKPGDCRLDNLVVPKGVEDFGDAEYLSRRSRCNLTPDGCLRPGLTAQPLLESPLSQTQLAEWFGLPLVAIRKVLSAEA